MLAVATVCPAITLYDNLGSPTFIKNNSSPVTVASNCCTWSALATRFTVSGQAATLTGFDLALSPSSCWNVYATCSTPAPNVTVSIYRDGLGVPGLGATLGALVDSATFVNAQPVCVPGLVYDANVPSTLPTNCVPVFSGTMTGKALLTPGAYWLAVSQAVVPVPMVADLWATPLPTSGNAYQDPTTNMWKSYQDSPWGMRVYGDIATTPELFWGLPVTPQADTGFPNMVWFDLDGMPGFAPVPAAPPIPIPSGAWTSEGGVWWMDAVQAPGQPAVLLVLTSGYLGELRAFRADGSNLTPCGSYPLPVPNSSENGGVRVAPSGGFALVTLGDHPYALPGSGTNGLLMFPLNLTATGTCLPGDPTQTPISTNTSIRNIDFNPQNPQQVVISGYSNIVTFMNPITGADLCDVTLNNGITRLEALYRPDGTEVWAASYDGQQIAVIVPPGVPNACTVKQYITGFGAINGLLGASFHPDPAIPVYYVASYPGGNLFALDANAKSISNSIHIATPAMTAVTRGPRYLLEVPIYGCCPVYGYTNTYDVSTPSNASNPWQNLIGAIASSWDMTEVATLRTVGQPDLTITKTHTGNFTQGQTTANFLITVTNSGASPTVGTVTVTDDLSGAPGLTVLNFAALTGANWVCSGTTCTRSDPLAAGASYDPIELTVSVAANASSPQVNHASVSGGGEVITSNNTATDSVIVTPLPDLTVTKDHFPTGFRQGQQGAIYILTVANYGSAATAGTITVTDELPAGLTFVSGFGPDFLCSASGQLVKCTNSGAPIRPENGVVIDLNVNVSATAAASLTNSATVACTCAESSTANNTSNTDTVNVTQLTPVTIASSPAGLALTVSGAGCQPGSYTAPQTLAWTPGASCAVSFASPQSGATGIQYVFSNWADDPSALSSRTLATPAGATTYTANFTTQYLLTTAANPSAGGTVSSGGWYNAGTTAAVAASPNNGYGLSSWTGATSSGLNIGTVLMDGPESVTGNFVLLTRVIVTTSSVGPGFTVDNTPYFGAQTFFWFPGAQHTIATSSPQTYPGAQFVFVNWSDGGAISHSVITPSTGITYRANFKTQYLLTTVASPAAGGSISPATGYVDAGTVSVSATANPTYVFYGFSGGGLSGTKSPQSIIVNAAVTVTATFVTGPDLTITKTHSGSFRQADHGDAYTITVTNSGQTATKGMITVSDTLPAGLTAGRLAGQLGWNCNPPGKLTCTSSGSLTLGEKAVFILTVNVAADAPASVTNTATVSGGGDVNPNNNTAMDVTAITQVADLTITKTHSGTFFQGQIGATYTITVHNAGLGPTVGAVIVTDTLPPGLTLITLFNMFGWSCSGTIYSATFVCGRTDPLGPGMDYPPIMLTVSVASNAPPVVTNRAKVSGGGELNTANDTASDQTTIRQHVPVTVMASPAGRGLTVIVDGTTFSTRQTFVWLEGDTHMIGTTTPQPPNPLAPKHYVFTRWSDNGAISHSITVPASGNTYTASFQ